MIWTTSSTSPRKKGQVRIRIYSVHQEQVYSYTLVSTANFDEISDLHKMPATLTFKSRKGKVYKGRLQGYVFDVGRSRLDARFENTPVTITFR